VVVCAGSAAANTTEPVSGLPIAPGFSQLTGSKQSYQFCGKSARSVSYMSAESDLKAELAWYTRELPGAHRFTAVGGVRTFITANGAAAVETAGGVISFFRFAPGLAPAEMKILGDAPAAKDCIAD
jgi:hypothetical protein